MVQAITAFNPEYNYRNRLYRAGPAFCSNKSSVNDEKSDIDIYKPIAIPAKQDSLGQDMLYAFGFIPTVRRVQSLPDSAKESNWARVAMLLAMAGLNFPRDLTEVRRAVDEGVNICKKGIAKTEFVDAQRPFYMLRGTMVQKWAEKHPWVKNIYTSLNKFDKTLHDTKLGEITKKVLRIKDPEKILINGSGFGSVPEFGYKFSNGYFKNVIGKSLFRISRLSLITTALFEVPALIKSLTQGETAKDKAKSFGKQLLKSAGYVALLSVGTAVAGAMVGPSVIAQLLGMGIGAGLSLMASKSLNKKIDKTFG